MCIKIHARMSSGATLKLSIKIHAPMSSGATLKLCIKIHGRMSSGVTKLLILNPRLEDVRSSSTFHLIHVSILFEDFMISSEFYLKIHIWVFFGVFKSRLDAFKSPLRIY